MYDVFWIDDLALYQKMYNFPVLLQVPRNLLVSWQLYLQSECPDAINKF